MAESQRKLRERIKKPTEPQLDVSQALEVTSPPSIEEIPMPIERKPITLARTGTGVPPTSEITISSSAPCFNDELRQRLIDELDTLIKKHWKIVENGEKSADKLIFYTKAQKLIAELQCPRKEVMVPNV